MRLKKSKRIYHLANMTNLVSNNQTEFNKYELPVQIWITDSNSFLIFNFDWWFKFEPAVGSSVTFFKFIKLGPWLGQIQYQFIIKLSILSSGPAGARWVVSEDEPSLEVLWVELSVKDRNLVNAIEARMI